MSIQGFIVPLSSHATTRRAAVRAAWARETQVEARISEKSGNIRTTLTMAFPDATAARSARAGRRFARSSSSSRLPSSAPRSRSPPGVSTS